jgi:hypothetical protein
VLLAAYALRRPTADIDFAGLQLSNDVASVRDLVAEVAAIGLPPELEDGLDFDLSGVRAETIREGDEYSGVRVRLAARLATARETFHVDVNVGDPIWPAPADVALPRLLAQEPIVLRGYPLEMVLAEKIITGIQRGVANTRWRDFGDIYQLVGRHRFQAQQLHQALQTVAAYRHVELVSLDDVLGGYAEIGQQRWTAWRRNLLLTDNLPADFGAALQALRDFANPVLTGAVGQSASWDPHGRHWAD